MRQERFTHNVTETATERQKYVVVSVVIVFAFPTRRAYYNYCCHERNSKRNTSSIDRANARLLILHYYYYKLFFPLRVSCAHKFVFLKIYNIYFSCNSYSMDDISMHDMNGAFALKYRLLVHCMWVVPNRKNHTLHTFPKVLVPLVCLCERFIAYSFSPPPSGFWVCGELCDESVWKLFFGG